jgi:Cu(I)/Ag(I) efflux system membrane fusion protein
MPLIQIPSVPTAAIAAPPDNSGKWTCPMHPEVIQDGPGACPKCNMALVRIPLKPLSAEDDDRMSLAVPITAVLDSGVRKLVYVERSKGFYVPVEIETGPRTDDAYPVLKGLKEGDKVVTRGAFLLDSQFQIRGLPSLFNNEGMSSPEPDHSQHTMPMNESKDSHP